MSSLLHGFEYLSTRDCCLISFNLAVFNWLSFVIIYGLGIRLNSQMNEVLVSSVFIIFVLQEKHSMACCQAYHILKRITSPSTISENPAPYVCGVLSHLPEFRYTPGSTHLVWLFPLSLSLSPVHIHTHTHTITSLCTCTPFSSVSIHPQSHPVRWMLDGRCDLPFLFWTSAPNYMTVFVMVGVF